MKLKGRFFMLMIAAAMILITTACQTSSEEQLETVNEESVMKKRVAILVAEGFHDGEAYMPMGYFVNQGFEVTVIGSEAGKVKSYNSDFTINIDKAVTEVNAEDFDALVLPGGKGPALLRENVDVVEFVKAFQATGRVIAAICHGPQVLITAGLVEGMTCTGVGGIQEELEVAGARFIDEPVVVDGNLVTSRVPGDLYDFSSTIVKKINEL